MYLLVRMVIWKQQLGRFFWEHLLFFYHIEETDGVNHATQTYSNQSEYPVTV